MLRFPVFECAYLKEPWFPPDLEWRNNWNLSVSHKKKRTSCLVLPLTPGVIHSSWRQASLSPLIAKGLSLAQVTGLVLRSLKSGQMNAALCGVEISTASWKTSLYLTKFYLLIFFCDSKFTVAFIYVYFFESFYGPAGPRHAEEQKPN